MTAVRQKSKDQLVNQRGGRGRGLALPAERPAGWKAPPYPIPAKELLPRVRHWWRELWESDVSAAIDPHADAERLYHWLRSLQDREALLDEIKALKWKVPTGSSWIEVDEDGQERVVRQMQAHPLLVYVRHLDGEIAKVSAEFGLSPQWRFRLGIEYGRAGREQAKMQEELAAEDWLKRGGGG